MLQINQQCSQRKPSLQKFIQIELSELLKDLKDSLPKKEEQFINQINETQQYLIQSKQNQSEYLQKNHDIVEFVLIMTIKILKSKQNDITGRSKEICILILSLIIQFTIPEDKSEILEKITQDENQSQSENYLFLILRQVQEKQVQESKFSFLFLINQTIVKMMNDIQAYQTNSDKLGKLLQQFVEQFYTIEVDEKKNYEIKEQQNCYTTQLSKRQFQQYEKEENELMFPKTDKQIQTKRTVQFKQQQDATLDLLISYLNYQLTQLKQIKTNNHNISLILPIYFEMIKKFMNIKTQVKSQFISEVIQLYTEQMSQIYQLFSEQINQEIMKSNQLAYAFSYIQLISINYEWATKTNDTIKFKQTINMMKQLCKICLQDKQLYPAYFSAYQNVILKLIENGNNEQLKYIAAQFITWQFCHEENPQKLNLLSNLFDLQGIPLVGETFNVLIKASYQEQRFQKNIVTNSFPTLKLGDLINNVYSNIDYSNKFQHQQHSCTCLADVCFMILIRILRLYQNSCLQNYQNQDLDNWFNTKQVFLQFNKSSKASKALDVLQQSNICDNQPYSLALLFIENNQQMNKAYIGEILGGNNSQSQQILEQFCEIVIKKIVDIDETKELSKIYSNSLRAFLSLFRMPGEGQLIDRIISQFSKTISKYTQFAYEPIYILSFATIMLNTDMHNVHVQTKMTLKEFITNIYRADKQKQLSEDFLSKIYKDIQQNPFTLDEVEEQRAYGLDGYYGLFEYYSHKLYNDVQAIEYQVLQLNTQQQDTTEMTDENHVSLSEMQSSITTPRAASMCQDLAIFCSPSQRNSDEIQEEQPFSSEEQQLESDLLKTQSDSKSQSSKLQLQTDTDEISMAPLSVCLTMTQHLSQDNSTNELENNEQNLQQQIKYQTLYVYLLKLHIDEIKDRLIQYYNTHLIKSNRYGKLNEICILTYRCLEISKNCKEGRSQLINSITLLPHIILQQYYYNSNLMAKQYQKTISSITVLDGTDFFPDDVVKLQKQIMDDFFTSTIMIVFVNDQITHQSRQQFLSMYFNLLTFSQVASFNKQDRRDYDQFMFQFDNIIDSQTKVRLEQYQAFYIYVQKKLDVFQQILDEIGQEKMKIQNASILLQLSPLETTEDLLNILPQHLTQNNYLIQDGQFKSQYQMPLQYGILVILQKISTELYTQLINLLQQTQHVRLDSDTLSKNNYSHISLDESQIGQQQKLLKQQIVTIYQNFDEKTVFQWLNKLFIQELNALINLVTDVDQFTDNYIQFQSFVVQHIQKLIAKYVSTFQYFTIKSENVFSDMLLILSHSIMGIKSQNALITLIETFLTQFSMINTADFNKYQDCMPFIIQTCLKLENQQQNNLSCQQCYHSQCSFERQKLSILKQERKTVYYQIQYNQQTITTFYTILSAFCNRIHMLSQENICQFYKYPLILLSKTNIKTVQDTVIDMIIQTAERLLEFSCLEIVEFTVSIYEIILQHTITQANLQYENKPLIEIIFKIYTSCLKEQNTIKFQKQERINAANTIYDNVLQPIISQQEANNDNSALNQLINLLVDQCDDQTFLDIFEKISQQTLTLCQVNQNNLSQVAFYLDQVFMKLFKKFVNKINEFQQEQQNSVKDTAFVNNIDYSILIQKYIVNQLIELYKQNSHLEDQLVKILQVQSQLLNQIYHQIKEQHKEDKYLIYIQLITESIQQCYKSSQKLNDKCYQLQLSVNKTLIELIYIINNKNRSVFQQFLSQLYSFTENNDKNQICQIYQVMIQYIQSQDKSFCEYLTEQLNNFTSFIK